MKFKGLSKIAIAGAALAATAATLGTSTYAWYVSNDKVAMDGVTGATAGTEVGANLVISGNEVKTGSADAPSSWGPSLTLAAADDRTDYIAEGSTDKFVAEALNPQSAEDITAASVAWKTDEGTAAVTSFIEFKVWIKNSKAASITPKFGIANTTAVANVKKQTAYNPNGLPTGVTAGDSFAVDAVNALRMEITKESVADYSADGLELSYTADTVTKEVFKVAEMAYDTTLTTKYSTTATNTANGTDFVTGGDANKYYKNMKNKAAYNTTGYPATDAAGTSKDAAENGAVYTGEKAAWSAFNVKADEAVKLTFKIWLEGADKDCWDSCINQAFAFNLYFEVTKEQNNG